MYKVYDTVKDKFLTRYGGFNKYGRVWSMRQHLLTSMSLKPYHFKGENLQVWHYAKDGIITKYTLDQFKELKTVREKKPRQPFKVPFVNGKMRDHVYRNETNVEYRYGLEEFTAELTFNRAAFFRSGTGAYFNDKSGTQYTMLPKALVDLIPHLQNGCVYGQWRFVNRSGSYGVELVKPLMNSGSDDDFDIDEILTFLRRKPLD